MYNSQPQLQLTRRFYVVWTEKGTVRDVVRRSWKIHLASQNVECWAGRLDRMEKKSNQDSVWIFVSCRHKQHECKLGFSLR